MSMSNYSTCPSPDSLPEFAQLPSIPKKIPTALIPARNGSYDAMVTCCAPNPVHLTKLDTQVEDCYVWCQLPANISTTSAFSSCLRRNDAYNRTMGGGAITGYQSGGGGALAGDVGRVVALAVAVTVLVNLLAL